MDNFLLRFVYKCEFLFHGLGPKITNWEIINVILECNSNGI